MEEEIKIYNERWADLRHRRNYSLVLKELLEKTLVSPDIYSLEIADKMHFIYQHNYDAVLEELLEQADRLREYEGNIRRLFQLGGVMAAMSMFSALLARR